MIELLLKLEMSLWVNETRNSKEFLEGVLHPDFKEFGRSGNIYNKQDIIDSTDLDINAIFPFKNLTVKDINDTTFLVTYQSALNKNNEIIKSNRSSIWILTEEGLKLLFHQGTPVK